MSSRSSLVYGLIVFSAVSVAVFQTVPLDTYFYSGMIMGVIIAAVVFALIHFEEMNKVEFNVNPVFFAFVASCLVWGVLVSFGFLPPNWQTFFIGVSITTVPILILGVMLKNR